MENAKYIEINASVRNPSSSIFNGSEDEDAKMPLIRFQMWNPVIELETGKILNWPEGNTAEINYKVCDSGEYWLLDEQKNRILKWKGYYVPDDILCTKRNGYGDYIIFDIQEDGTVKNWKSPILDEDEWGDEQADED